jgi:PAS domain S-box-containing protein
MKHVPASVLREPARLAQLQEAGLSAATAEPTFDVVTALVTSVLQVPASMITLTAADAELIAASTGLPEGWGAPQSVPLDYSYAQFMLASDEPLLVDDARKHPLVRGSPAIDEWHAVAYAGTPLHGRDGRVLGALCAIDSAPRSWLETEVAHLELLGVVAEQAIGWRLLLHEGTARREVTPRPSDQELLDIAECKKTVDALRDSATRLELIERATEDVIWDCDVRTGTIGWSEPGSRSLRYRPDEVGSSIDWHQERIHPEDRERVVRSLQSTLDGISEKWTQEYRFRRGDGGYACVLDRACILRGERGEPVRMIGSMMDVTERRREEEAQRFLSRASVLLERSLSTGSALARVARLCVPWMSDYCQIDLREPDGTLRRVATAHTNPSAEEALVRTEPFSTTALQSRLLDEREPLLLPECSSSDLKALGYDEGQRELLRGQHICSVMVAPMVISERALGLVTLATVDSGRRQDRVDLLVAEDLARRIAFMIDHARLFQEMTDAVRARDRVLAVLSHDLRSPLNVIQMTASMLQDARQERRSENQRWLDLIVRNAGWMDELIGDLLDLTRIQGGHLTVQRSEQSVAAVVADATDLLEPLATQAGIRLETDVDPDLPLASVDAGRILRAIANLVDNALKFTPRGGTVTVQARRGEGELVISVTDTGPGIPAEQLPHVFDRYWQASASDRRGTGLGLTIVKGIAEAHGGRVWVESTPGDGTTFFFSIPLQPA